MLRLRRGWGRVEIDVCHIRHYAQVPSAQPGWLIGQLSLDRDRTFVTRTGRLTHGVGESLQVIDAGLEGVGIGSDAHHLPAFGRGESIAMHLAQVVAVRLGIGCKRTDDCR